MSLDAWALSPEALAANGLGLQALTVFRRLQRPWQWGANGPVFGKRWSAKVDALGIALPQIVEAKPSTDGSTKLLLEIDGDRIETVHMPRRVSTQRVTICLSSQVGCGMGCRFCATARMGFVRQLSAGEIVAQLMSVLHRLGPRHPSDLTLVFMGMGEPLANLGEVRRAIEIFCHPQGLGLSPRRITVSTSGLLDEISRLARWTHRPLLAVSLNATTDDVRRALMPVSRLYTVEALRHALERFPLRSRERITIEYVLIRDKNDRREDAERLARFVDGFPHQVNLIVYNEWDGVSMQAPSEERIDEFARWILMTRPTVVTVRRSRGCDIRGACGQLASRGVNPAK